MNEREAVHVLAVCSSYDGRKPSTVDAQTWAYELKHVERDTAVEAVRNFYRANPDGRIRPGHVTEYASGQRKPGLERSSRVENAAVEALDPDDPDYDRKYLEAIQSSRRAAGDAPEAIPGRVAIGGRTPDPGEWAERSRRGNDKIRAALADANQFRADRSHDNVPENLRRARAVAASYKSAKRHGDPEQLGRAGGQLMTQISNKRATARTSEEHQ